MPTRLLDEFNNIIRDLILCFSLSTKYKVNKKNKIQMNNIRSVVLNTNNSKIWIYHEHFPWEVISKLCWYLGMWKMTSPFTKIAASVKLWLAKLRPKTKFVGIFRSAFFVCYEKMSNCSQNCWIADWLPLNSCCVVLEGWKLSRVLKLCVEIKPSI